MNVILDVSVCIGTPFGVVCFGSSVGLGCYWSVSIVFFLFGWPSRLGHISFNTLLSLPFLHSSSSHPLPTPSPFFFSFFHAMHDPRPAVDDAMHDPRPLPTRQKAETSLKHWQEEPFFYFFYHLHHHSIFQFQSCYPLSSHPLPAPFIFFEYPCVLVRFDFRFFSLYSIYSPLLHHLFILLFLYFSFLWF